MNNFLHIRMTQLTRIKLAVQVISQLLRSVGGAFTVVQNFSATYSDCWDMYVYLYQCGTDLKKKDTCLI